MSKHKVIFLISHPVQYYVPLFQELTNSNLYNFEVFYCSKEGYTSNKDIGFGITYKWNIPLLVGYTSTFLRNYSIRPGVSKGFFGLINFDIWYTIIREQNLVLIVHGWHYFTNFTSIILAWLLNRKVMIRGDNPLFHEHYHSKSKLLIKKIILPALLKLCTAALYVGKQNQMFFKFYGVKESKLFFAPHSIDNNRFVDIAKVNEKYSLRKKYGIHPDSFVILFCGKLIAKKRPFDILNAVAKISVSKKIFVLFAGDGELRRQIEEFSNEYLPNRYRITGFINQNEIPEVYQVSDIIILPSGFGETWGLVVNEAMSLHLPAIVSNMCGCADDLIREGENGFIYPCGNTDLLLEKVLFAVDNPEWCKNAGELSANIIANYNVSSTASGIINAINYTINNDKK